MSCNSAQRVNYKVTADYIGTIKVDSYWQMVAVCACLEALCWQCSLQKDACLHPVHSTAAPSAVPKTVLTSTTTCIKHSQHANRDEVYFCHISPAMYLRQYAQTALCRLCVTVKITGDSRNTNSPAAIGVADTKPRPDPGMSTVSIRTITTASCTSQAAGQRFRYVQQKHTFAKFGLVFWSQRMRLRAVPRILDPGTGDQC